MEKGSTTLIFVVLLVALAAAQEEVAHRFVVIRGSCTNTCGGKGLRPFLVACVNNLGASVDETNCAGQTRPPTPPMEPCNRQHCEPGWETSPFGPCSGPCGMQFRNVTCIQHVVFGDHSQPFVHGPDDENALVSNEVCANFSAAGPEPASSQACEQDKCFTYQWSSGPYGACSSGCGLGRQTRPVFCQRVSAEGTTAVVSDDECARNVSAVRPDESRPCDVNCRYVYGDWSDCVFAHGETCGDGQQTRLVTCLNEDTGATVDRQFCDEDATITDSRPPLTQSQCRVECPCLEPRWVPSDWGRCSVTCGNGTQIRSLVCRCLLGRNDEVVDDSECEAKALGERPPELQQCGDECPCLSPRWETSSWGDCSRTCAGGTRTRQVQCACQRGDVDKIEPDSTCSNAIPGEKPASSEQCNIDDCPCVSPRWEASSFSTCHRPCGGSQSRTISCSCPIETRQGQIRQTVNNTFCRDLLPQAPPEAERPCPDRCCFTALPTSPWSECSVTCGDGVQTRSAVCGLRICPDGKLVGQTDDSECTNQGIDLESERRRNCSARVRAGSSVWQTSSWTPCSNTCGRGLKYRKVTCVDKCSGQRRSDKKCATLRRPPNRKYCKCVPCDENESRNDERFGCYLVQVLGLCRTGGCQYQYRCSKSCYHDVISEP